MGSVIKSAKVRRRPARERELCARCRKTICEYLLTVMTSEGVSPYLYAYSASLYARYHCTTD